MEQVLLPAGLHPFQASVKSAQTEIIHMWNNQTALSLGENSLFT